MMGWNPDLPAMGWGQMAFGALYMLLVWSLLLAITFVAARALVGRLYDDDPRSILRRRFTAGEISPREFEEASRALRR